MSSSSNSILATGGGVAKNPFFQDYAWLGVPDKVIQPSHKDYKSPYVSKIGGQPAWLVERHFNIAVVDEQQEEQFAASTLTNKSEEVKNEEEKTEKVGENGGENDAEKNEEKTEDAATLVRRAMVPDIPATKQLSCRVCNSKLYLVTQAYAPLGHFDRFLYVFACNNRHCDNRDGSWVAYRTQFEVFDESSSSNTDQKQDFDAQNDQKVNVIDEKNLEKIKESVKEWKKEENLDQELESLMQTVVVDGSSTPSGQGNNKKQQKKKKKKKNKEKKDEPVPKFALPCYSLDIYEEPEEGEEYLDENDGGEGGSSGGDDGDLKLNKYKALMSGASGNSEEYDDEELAAFGKYMTSAAQSGKVLVGTGGGSSSDDTTNELSELAKLEGNKVHVSPVLMKFHEEVSKEPNQSIRWQFGGEPLWINDHPSTLPSGYSQKRNKQQQGLVRVQQQDDDDDDDDEDQIKSDYILKPNVSPYIPPCPSCGAARVFELQIMPTLIYQLRPDLHCHKKGEDQGMEFGTVTVFTCSGQCSGRSKEEIESGSAKIKYVKEHVHVQPAV